MSLPLVSLAVVADGLDRAALHGFLTLGLFFGRLGLLVNETVAPVVVAFEVGRSGFPAKIAVDALVINVELPIDVLWIFVCDVSHTLGH